MSMLLGHQLRKSEKVEKLVKELRSTVEELSLQIKGVSPASSATLIEQNKKQMDRIGLLRGRPLHYPYIGTGLGRGPYVELEDGSIKLDLINGIGIHLFGHSHPRIVEAGIRGALADIVMQGNLQPNLEYLNFSEKLAALVGKHSRLKHAWFATCGTMANETALKIARQKKTPARMIISFTNAFAGRSTMMAELTDNPAYRQGLPEYHEVLRLPFFDKKDPLSGETSLRALKEHIEKHKGNIAAFCFEPMLGEGGYQPAPTEFFVPLFELCKKEGIPVWADEVQTFSRTGELFAFETLKIGQYIDLCTIAKTAQLGVTFYTEEYNPKPGLVAGTFSGSTVSMTTGMAMIDMITQDGYLGPQGRIQKIHQRFVDGINRLNEGSCKGLAQDAGGLGLMVAFTPFDGKKEQVDPFLKKLFSNGLIAFGCGKNPVRVRFLIPAIIQDQDIDIALGIIEKSMLEMA